MRIGANGARGMLFCAAKRSGAFPPSMPAELRARVLRLGGFMRPFYHASRTKGQRCVGVSAASAEVSGYVNCAIAGPTGTGPLV